MDAAMQMDTVPMIDAPIPAVCGDQVVEDEEECDDGNDVNTDGCVACKWAVCGDGKVRRGVEECDEESENCSQCKICLGDNKFAYNGHCYERVTSGLSYSQAQESCGAKGGYLATLTSDEEWMSIVGSSFWVDPFDSTWMGLTRSSETEWQWQDGSLFTANHWEEGAPNNSGGNENCVALSGSEGKWDDFQCSLQLAYICESPKWHIDTQNNHAYRLFYDSRPWVEANGKCANLGGHLVTITTAAEQEFVAGLTLQPIWIGALQGPSEGPFNWVTGEQGTYSFWAEGQPDNENDGDCLEMESGGAWNDLNCGERRYFLCEID